MESTYRIEKFFGDLRFRYRIVRAFIERTNRYLAHDFNLVGITAPEEQDISRYIALLLDPKGAHGQGDVFLRKFLETLQQSFPNGMERLLEEIDHFESTKVSTEATIHKRRRLDLLITLPNQFMIGIENKIWAGDQLLQIADYNEYLRDRASDYVLVFLSCFGREPSEYSIGESERRRLESEGKFVSMSYREFLIPWLDACLKECEAEKVRWFIRDFIAWIQETCTEA